MSQGLLVGFWLGLAVVAANLPWLSERWLCTIPRQRAKPSWLRLAEWGLLYGLVVGVGFGFEYKTTGVLHTQGWEFYVVTLCLFAVSAMPGFIYRHQLRRLLQQSGQ
ncbi:MAG: DUF2818 family protein [Candidatus Competibacteraceae bacterium]|nr:MAG: DUF2818 family protein [Candidatus Competibacteraceae bacterium]